MLPCLTWEHSQRGKIDISSIEYTGDDDRAIQLPIMPNGELFEEACELAALHVDLHYVLLKVECLVDEDLQESMWLEGAITVPSASTSSG